MQSKKEQIINLLNNDQCRDAFLKIEHLFIKYSKFSKKDSEIFKDSLPNFFYIFLDKKKFLFSIALVKLTQNLGMEKKAISFIEELHADFSLMNEDEMDKYDDLISTSFSQVLKKEKIIRANRLIQCTRDPISLANRIEKYEKRFEIKYVNTKE